MNSSALSGFVGGFADMRGIIDARKRRDAAEAARRPQPMGIDERTEGRASDNGMGQPATPMPALPANPTVLDLTAATEGGNSYDTLYGNAQRGGKFDAVDVTKMSLGDLASFSDPSGDYGKWVAGNNNGVVATPMGRHQIVGSTLRAAATEMGLSPDTLFSQQTQDAIASHLARKRLATAKSPSQTRAALRAEWTGFNNVPDSALDTAIANFEANGGTLTPRPMGVSQQ